RSILQQGRTIQVSDPMIKTREKMGLPNLGSPPVEQLTKVLRNLKLAKRLESTESRYGGGEDE
ncbi:MAG: hypothetical protein ACFFH0_04755, partial [Promethearchaeota archaeon]